MRKVVALFFLLAACASSPTAPAKMATPAPPVPAWDIANIDNPRVDYWVSRFTSDKREEFASYLARMKDVQPMISARLSELSLPQDLIYMAMIESGFNPQAHSAADARGIWQLTPDTARRYKLRVDETVDERLDPQKSTDAALEYLRDLYGRFGSWYLSAAAYNSGEGRVGGIMRAVSGSEWGTDADYYRIWDRLPGETRDFIPVMVAAARIAKEPARYGF